MLGQATAVFVSLAAGITPKLSLLGTASDEIRAFTGTSISALGGVFVVGPSLFIHRHVLECVLLNGIGGSTWTKVGMHARSRTH